MAKYVQIDTPEAGPTFFIIPDHVAHADFARKFEGRAVLSAGMISWGNDGPHCYGKSVSLGVGSFPDDTARLWRQMGIEVY